MFKLMKWMIYLALIIVAIALAVAVSIWILPIAFLILLGLAYRDYKKAQALKASEMVCPNCGSTNIKIQSIQTGEHTGTKGIGGGAGIGLGKSHLAVPVAGAGGTSKNTEFKYKREGVCQDCGFNYDFITPEEVETEQKSTKTRLIVTAALTALSILVLIISLASGDKSADSASVSSTNINPSNSLTAAANSEAATTETTTAIALEPKLAADENGNWYYYDEKGNVQSSFTGVVANEAGEWMVEKGQVNFDYDGTYMDDKGTTYVISGGKATSKSETDLGNVSVEFKNALAKAQSYSDMMNMSKAGIYNQLTSEYGESFAADAAQFAVDHVNANYNANALAKAESYQSMMNMSKNGIYDQLVSDFGEKFTASQAQYAVDHLPA